jgi:hypothetical protein
MGMIHVTQEDITLGCRGLARACPISRAVRRRLAELGQDGLGADVDVGTDHFVVRLDPDNDESELHIYDMPESAMQFVSDFDGGWPVKPIAFEAVRK